MFIHKMDRLCEAEFKKMQLEMDQLKMDLKACEDKLDQLLHGADEENRSILTKQGKPEELAASPGHIPWSQRKAERQRKTRSPEFLDKVRKGSAPTEPIIAKES